MVKAFAEMMLEQTSSRATNLILVVSRYDGKSEIRMTYQPSELPSMICGPACGCAGLG